MPNPGPNSRARWASSRTRLPRSPTRRAQKAVLARADAALHAFPGHARLRRVHLTLEEWTESNGLLTATQKARRGKLLEHYAEAIDRLYRK